MTLKKAKNILTKLNYHIIKDYGFAGGLAQSVERRNHNPCVVGSNPSPATIIKKAHFLVSFFIICKGWDLNPRQSGFDYKREVSESAPVRGDNPE